MQGKAPIQNLDFDIGVRTRKMLGHADDVSNEFMQYPDKDGLTI